MKRIITMFITVAMTLIWGCTNLSTNSLRHDQANPGEAEGANRACILFVRIKSDLDPEELEQRLLERKPHFQEVPGLVQKIYGRDEATGDLCGIYFFADTDSLASFSQTELAKTIATAYEVTEIRKETYQVLFPLHPARGPSMNH